MKSEIWRRFLEFICHALLDLVPFVQFKTCEKQPWRSAKLLACNFTKSNTPPWVFFTFFKLYRWYQIAQNITFVSCMHYLHFVKISVVKFVINR